MSNTSNTSTINIGNNNKIKHVVINQGNHGKANNEDGSVGEFVKNHPIIIGVGCSLIAALIWAVLNGDSIEAFLYSLITQ